MHGRPGAAPWHPPSGPLPSSTTGMRHSAMAEFSATSLAATPVVLIALTAGLLLTLAIGQAVQVAERRRRQRRQLATALQLRARARQDALPHLAAGLLGQQLQIGRGHVCT